MTTQQHQSANDAEFLRALIGGTDTDKVAASVARVATTSYGELAGGVSSTADRFAAQGVGAADVAQDTETVIEWDDPTVLDPSYSWDDGTPEVITIAEDGVYFVTLMASVNAVGGTGTMSAAQLTLYLDGLTAARPNLDVYAAPAAGAADLVISTVFVAEAGDLISAEAYTEGTANWNLAATAGTHIMVIKLG